APVDAAPANVHSQGSFPHPPSVRLQHGVQKSQNNSAVRKTIPATPDVQQPRKNDSIHQNRRTGSSDRAGDPPRKNESRRMKAGAWIQQQLSRDDTSQDRALREHSVRSLQRRP